MNRLLALFAVASLAFGVVTAAAASLGTMSGGAISAANLAIEKCGTASSVTLGYEMTTGATAYVVDKVVLTATGGGSFTGSPSCDTHAARVAFGTNQVLSRNLTSGDFTVSGTVLTLDVTDTNAAAVANFAILIE